MLNHKVFGRPLFLLPVKVLWMMSFSRLLCGASFGHQNCATFWSSHLLTVFTYSTFLGEHYYVIRSHYGIGRPSVISLGRCCALPGGWNFRQYFCTM